jgi:hypothetical protein
VPQALGWAAAQAVVAALAVVLEAVVVQVVARAVVLEEVVVQAVARAVVATADNDFFQKSLLGILVYGLAKRNFQNCF